MQATEQTVKLLPDYENGHAIPQSWPNSRDWSSAIPVDEIVSACTTSEECADLAQDNNAAY